MSKKRVLHVDDEESICYIVRRALSNYEVVSAHNLGDAKEKAKEDFDLYIIDGEFPSEEKGLAGLYFYNYIKSKRKPCIFVCSENPLIEEIAFESNTKYLKKPFEIRELIECINSILD